MDDQDMLIFKEREKAKNAKIEKEETEQEKDVYQPDNRYNASGPWNVNQADKRRLTKKELEEKALAENKQCNWHSWRSAYAICAYCSKPFCFEDIVEENGRYYCLEDVDRIATHETSYKSTISTNTGFVSGTLFLMPLLVFIYFRMDDLLTSINYMQTTGIIKFATTFIYVYSSAFPLIGIILSVLGVISGIMVFMGTKRSGPIGIFFGLLMVLFFGYQYMLSPFIYNLAIAGSSFLAFILLIISKATFRPEPIETIIKHERSELPIGIPNVGRF